MGATCVIGDRWVGYCAVTYQDDPLLIAKVRLYNERDGLHIREFGLPVCAQNGKGLGDVKAAIRKRGTAVACIGARVGDDRRAPLFICSSQTGRDRPPEGDSIGVLFHAFRGLSQGPGVRGGGGQIGQVGRTGLSVFAQLLRLIPVAAVIQGGKGGTQSQSLLGKIVQTVNFNSAVALHLELKGKIEGMGGIGLYLLQGRGRPDLFFFVIGEHTESAVILGRRLYNGDTLRQAQFQLDLVKLIRQRPGAIGREVGLHRREIDGDNIVQRLTGLDGGTFIPRFNGHIGQIGGAAFAIIVLSDLLRGHKAGHRIGAGTSAVHRQIRAIGGGIQKADGIVVNAEDSRTLSGRQGQGVIIPLQAAAVDTYGIDLRFGDGREVLSEDLIVVIFITGNRQHGINPFHFREEGVLAVCQCHAGGIIDQLTCSQGRGRVRGLECGDGVVTGPWCGGAPITCIRSGTGVRPGIRLRSGAGVRLGIRLRSGAGVRLGIRLRSGAGARPGIRLRGGAGIRLGVSGLHLLHIFRQHNRTARLRCDQIGAELVDSFCQCYNMGRRKNRQTGKQN